VSTLQSFEVEYLRSPVIPGFWVVSTGKASSRALLNFGGSIPDFCSGSWTPLAVNVILEWTQVVYTKSTFIAIFCNLCLANILNTGIIYQGTNDGV